MVRTTDDLINKIKRRSFIPISQSTFTDEEILEIATEELVSIIVPTILNTRQEYYVFKDTSSILNGTSDQVFNIPPRATGMQLREVTVTIGNNERNLARYDIEDRVYNNVGGNVFGFDITNNQLNIKGNNSGILNLYYYLRPGNLVKSSSARAIQSIDAANKQITFNSLVSNWSTNTEFDVIKCKPGFDHKAINLTVNNIDTITNIITFNENFPTETWKAFAVGDWLVEAEKSPVPQIPLEWQEYLAEAVVAYMMDSVGDSEAFQRASVRKEELKKLAVDSISPRVDGQSKKQVPRRNRGAYVYSSWDKV